MTSVPPYPSGPADVGVRLVWFGPTPSTGRVAFRLDSPVAAPSRLDLFDALGRRVRRIESRMPVGQSELTWDGLGDDGKHVESGVYFFRLSSRVSEVARGRVVLIP